MHRTLKRSLDIPLAADLPTQQRQLDDFRRHYNDQRPHEGLAQRPPAQCYAPSPRPYPRRLPGLEYPSYFHSGRVSRNGVVYWRALRIYIGYLLAGEWIGIEAIGDGVWDVYFGPVHLGQFDERLPSGRQGDYLSLRV